MKDNKLQNYIKKLDLEKDLNPKSKLALIEIATSIYNDTRGDAKMGFSIKEYWKDMLASVEKKETGSGTI